MSRQLVIDAVDGGEAGECTPLTIRSVCDPDGSPAPVTRVTSITLDSQIIGVGTRGQFSNSPTCTTLLGAPATLAQQQDSLSLFFKPTLNNNTSPAFGRYLITASPDTQPNELFAPGMRTLEQYAGLTFGTTSVINVPTNAGCVHLPALKLESTAGPIVAPASLSMNVMAPAGMTLCSPTGPLLLVANTPLNADISLSASVATTGPLTLFVTTVEPLVRNTSIQVHPCLPAGSAPGPGSPAECCNGFASGTCL